MHRVVKSMPITRGLKYVYTQKNLDRQTEGDEGFG